MTDIEPTRLPPRRDNGWEMAIAAQTQTPFSIISARRGWDEAALHDLEESTTELLPDIDKAVALLHHAATNRLEITVLTDYDMDGVAAGLLTYAGLNELGITTNLVVPHYEGVRDVDAPKVNQAVAQYPRTGLIMTCDVGINSNNGIDRAHELGFPVIIADHHIEEATPCRADAVVDPNRTGCTYPEPDICGSQVALHILLAYAQAHRPDKVSDISLLAVFGGIGGLADVMPLRGQTRALVRRSLALLRLAFPTLPLYTIEDTKRAVDPVSFYKVGTPNLENPDLIDIDGATLMTLINLGDHHPAFAALFRGVAILLAELALAGKITTPDDLDTSFLGFSLTPMFNATRRVEGDMADSFAIFAREAVKVSRPDHRAGFADERARRESARAIIDNNERRKLLTREALATMLADEQPLAPHIWFSDAVPGVLGLLASNAAELTGGPVVVVNPQRLRGSARAPQWVDVLGTVKSLNRPGLWAAGHHQACGVGAGSLDDLTALAHAFTLAVQARPQPSPEELRADLHLVELANVSAVGRIPDVDMIMPTKAVLIGLCEQLRALEPFGQGWVYPDIRITFQPSEAKIELLSRKEDAPEVTPDNSGDPSCFKHFKVTLESGVQLLMFNANDQYDDLVAAPSATATVTLGINNFAGAVRPQGIINSLSID